jgi:hypothetical protein
MNLRPALVRESLEAVQLYCGGRDSLPFFNPASDASMD